MFLKIENGLGKGDVFGDQFWKDQPLGQSAANVRALTYCDLHAIKRDKLLEVLLFYKAFAISFARNLVLTYNLRHRLIFRKVADVKREKELDERKKDEPHLASSQDHLVRKIFSKFRRTPQPCGKDGTQSDVEKGDNQSERGKVGSMLIVCIHIKYMLRLSFYRIEYDDMYVYGNTFQRFRFRASKCFTCICICIDIVLVLLLQCISYIIFSFPPN